MVLCHTYKGHDQQKILIHVLFCQKASDLSIDQHRQKQAEQDYSTKQVESNIGIIDKEILICPPAVRMCRLPAQTVLFDLCSE